MIAAKQAFASIVKLWSNHKESTIRILRAATQDEKTWTKTPCGRKGLDLLVGNTACKTIGCGVISTTRETDAYMKFGELVKDLRIAKELTLRQCCAELDVDPSNWSKMERGITPPPKDESHLEKWAHYLGLKAEKKQEFMDLAALARQEIPPDMATDETVIAALPAFFRAVRGHELEGERLKQFIEDLRAVHSNDRRGSR